MEIALSELTWALLAIAAVMLAALYLYGKWQERKSRGGLEESTHLDTDPSLPVASRVTAARSTREPPARIEPTIGAIAAESELARQRDSAAQAGSGPPAVDGWVEDALLDVMLELRCSHAFDGVAALDARAQLDRLALPLPTHLVVWDSKAARWSAPDRFGFYSEMLIAVQLAARRHSLGEIDASRFVSAVQQIAVSIDADFDPPDVVRLVHQANELDRLCARFDVQITLTLEAPAEPWSDDAVKAAAAEAGLSQVEPTRWERLETRQPVTASASTHSMSAASTSALSMIAASSPAQRLTLILDVPRATVNPPPLPILFAIAHQLAGRLNARLVDDNGRAVESVAQSAIEAELDKLTTDMRAAGIEPGSLRARRLYAD